MKLDETIGLMCSDDYKDRLKAEYLQLSIRMRDANKYWEKMEDKTSPEGGHLLEQMGAMKSYRHALRKRLYDVGLFPDSLDAVIGEE